MVGDGLGSYKNGCVGGPKFVSAYTYNGYYVGLQQCTGYDRRFKFYVSDDPTSNFFPVCDGDGSGENQCRLIGGSDGVSTYTTNPAPSKG